MKKILFLLTLPLFLFSCYNQKQIDENEKYEKQKYESVCEFGEKSELRVFKSEVETSSSSSGWYCIAVGSYSSSNRTYKYIKLYAKNKKGCFCYFKCDVEKVQFKIDNNVKIPTVEFLMDESWFEYFRTKTIIEQQLKSDNCDMNIVVTCTDKQFPSELNFLQ